jgi:hypothetical protein
MGKQASARTCAALPVLVQREQLAGLGEDDRLQRDAPVSAPSRVAYLGLPGVLVWDGERDNRGVLGALDQPPEADDAPVTLVFLPQ